MEIFFDQIAQLIEQRLGMSSAPLDPRDVENVPITDKSMQNMSLMNN